MQVCAIQDAVGGYAIRRTPILTDMLLNLEEGQPNPFGTLTAHV